MPAHSAEWRKRITTGFGLMLALCLTARAWAGSGDYTVNGDATVTPQNGVDIGVNINSAAATAADGVLSPTAGLNNNTVTVINGSKNDPYYVFGGLAVQTTGIASSTGNTVTMAGGAVMLDPAEGSGTSYSGTVTGGWAVSQSNNATVDGNTVSMTGGTIQGSLSWSLLSGGLMGGYAVTGTTVSDAAIGVATASGNTVSMSAGTIYNGGGVVGGGAVAYNSDGSVAAAGSIASNNSAIVTGDAAINDGSVYGGWARAHNGYGDATATGNRVILSGNAAVNGGNPADYSGSVYGGWARSSSLYAANGNATTSNNTVLMTGGSINDGGNLYGGYAYGYTAATSVQNNTATVTGGAVSGRIYGGYAEAMESAANHASGAASATGNTVVIGGGDFTRSIYGGYASSENGAAGSTASATGNAVTIFGAPVFNAGNVTLYGGRASVNGADLNTYAHTIQGNALNLNNTAVAVLGAKNFEYYNFLLPNAANATMLTATTAVALSGTGTDAVAWKSNINIAGVANGQRLNAGDTITLINNTTGTFKINGADYAVGSNDTIYGVRQGIALRYDMLVSLDANALNAIIGGVRAAPEAKSLVEGRAAGFAALSTGADLIAGSGLEHALAATDDTRGSDDSASGHPGPGIQPFLALTGGFLRYNTGSHVDVTGIASMLGLGKRFAAGTGALVLGAFFENGYGSYNSYMDGGNGHGNGAYYGGGVLTRYDVLRGKAAGMYGEASFRVGSLRNKYQGDFIAGAGAPQYTVNATYFGGHAGLGYVHALSESFSLDASLKYFWLHQNGNDLTLMGDPFSFASLDSHRLRPSLRLSYDMKNGVKPYLGGAYEYEFSGKAKATTFGLDIPAPSIKGSTGMLELGVGIAPLRTNDRLRLDLGVQGYVGKKNGVMGLANIRYVF